MKKIIFFLLLTFSASPSYSQYTDYFPMHVGNIFIYNYHYVAGSYTRDSTIVMRVVNDTTLNGKIYYNVVGRYNRWLRLDSLTGSLYYYDSLNSCPLYNYEMFVDSLGAKMNDQITNSCYSSSLRCNDTSVTSVFGFPTKRKNFHFSISIPMGGSSTDKTFTKKFGLTSNESHFFFVGGSVHDYTTLRGCIIDGVVYGDTTLTAVNHLVTEIPATFHLHQNYPNPFNPSTRIKFDIPRGALVKLKIYDMLGREVAQLVNENLSTGTYEYEWSGIALPSGVYFYKLITDSFTETKRMVLVK